MSKVSSNLVDYSSLESISGIWKIAAERFGDVIALYDPHTEPEIRLSYDQLYRQIRDFAAGLQVMEVKPGTKIALFADNSPRWLIADQGIILAGGVNAVRSSQAEQQELLYILEDSDSQVLVVENLKTLAKISPQLEDLPITLVILLSDETPAADGKIKILNFSQLLDLGASHDLASVEEKKDRVATLIYTSGTTGKPKGVMLSHGNILHQVNNFSAILRPKPGDRIVSILPTWHSYERTCEYYLLSRGCTQLYSNIKSIKQDLKEFKPQYMVAVPRLWESIYEGVQKQFREQPATKQKLINFFLKISQSYIIAKRITQGLSLDHLHASGITRLIAQIKVILLSPLHTLGEKIVYQKVRLATGAKLEAVISGGGSLARHLDDFFEIVGINILVGYGLTETSPVATVRTLEHNLRGSAGKPIPYTEIRIVDPETRQTLPQEARGLVLIRGPQVMKGYYKKPEATAKVIDAEGWFDSGDLGWLTPTNDLVLTGRVKDTIVLTNGENIEPQPIEDACLRSTYIDQIMLVGQDQRSLGALIVPNVETLQAWIREQNLAIDFDSEMINSHPAIEKLFRQELNREVQNRPGYRPDDRIGPLLFLLESFSQENGMMTQTMKIKRPVVNERYHDKINKMFV